MHTNPVTKIVSVTEACAKSRSSSPVNSFLQQAEFYRLLDDLVTDDADVFDEKLQEWEPFYNHAGPRL